MVAFYPNARAVRSLTLYFNIYRLRTNRFFLNLFFWLVNFLLLYIEREMMFSVYLSILVSWWSFYFCQKTLWTVATFFVLHIGVFTSRSSLKTWNPLVFEWLNLLHSIKKCFTITKLNYPKVQMSIYYWSFRSCGCYSRYWMGKGYYLKDTRFIFFLEKCCYVCISKHLFQQIESFQNFQHTTNTQ